MPNKIGDKYFLGPGDLISVNNGTLEYFGEKIGYKLADLTDATLNWYDEKEETNYEVTYAWDLPKDDPNYGEPYFSK